MVKLGSSIGGGGQPPASTRDFIALMMVDRCTFQGDDLADRIHDSRVRRDGPGNQVGGICEVDNNDFFVGSIPNADEAIRFKRQGVESDAGRIDAQVLELQQVRTDRVC